MFFLPRAAKNDRFDLSGTPLAADAPVVFVLPGVVGQGTNVRMHLILVVCLLFFASLRGVERPACLLLLVISLVLSRDASSESLIICRSLTEIGRSLKRFCFNPASKNLMYNFF